MAPRHLCLANFSTFVEIAAIITCESPLGHVLLVQEDDMYRLHYMQGGSRELLRSPNW